MDDAVTRIEQALVAALAAGGEATGCPPRLAAAVRYAVFPGGARIRPRLCLAVAAACGEDDPTLTDFAAAAIELLHCASLVHDDLPCFDDAPMRRGKPSVHRAFGERLAVLAGDALIVRAFQTLAQGAHACSPHRLGPLLGVIGACGGHARRHRGGAGVGVRAARVARRVPAGEDRGALRCRDRCRRDRGRRGPDSRGARWASGSARPIRWRTTSATWPGTPDDLGKPIGRDAALGRPSAAGELGLAGAIQRLEHLVAGAIDSIPPCAGADELRAHILLEAAGLLPPRARAPGGLTRLARTRSRRQAHGSRVCRPHRPGSTAGTPLRDRLLASPGFQRTAAAFPLTRPIARRRARALFDLCAGFVYSQVLLACVRLRLFDILAEGPQTVAALSVRLVPVAGGHDAAALGRGLAAARRAAWQRTASGWATSGRPWSAIPASPRWWSITRCSTRISRIPSPCCAGSGRTRNSRATGRMLAPTGRPRSTPNGWRRTRR